MIQRALLQSAIPAILLVVAGLAQPARLELNGFASTIVGHRQFYTYLPPGYDSTAERYPVVILLRGVESEWITPNQDAARRGSIMTVADTLWSSGALKDCILIMPRIGSPPTWSDMEYLATELIPWVDAHYRTIPTRWQRAVDGFSYGGLGSAMLFTRAPSLFASVGGYDGSLFLYNPNLMELWKPERLALFAPIQYLFTTTGPGMTGNQSVTRAFVDTLAKYGIINAYADLHLTSDAQHNWYFADLHAARNLPRHGQRFANGFHNLDVQVSVPAADSTLHDVVVISWNVLNPPLSLRVFVLASSNGGDSWTSLGESQDPDSSITWNTAASPDGTRYLVNVIVAGDTSYFQYVTSGTFRVDNAGNGAPDIALLNPVGTLLSGDVTIQWTSDDAEGVPPVVRLQVSADNGNSWQTLADGLASSGTFDWNTRAFPNGSTYRIRATASDGELQSSASTVSCVVFNEREETGFVIQRISGTGDWESRAHIVGGPGLSFEPIRVSFERNDDGLRYTVRRATNDAVVVDRALVGRPEDEGPLFHGMRLTMTTVDTPSVWTDSTRWISDRVTLSGTVSLPEVITESDTIRGTAIGHDHEIVFADHMIDTSVAAFGVPAIPVPFTVQNSTMGWKTGFIFVDGDANGSLSHGDELFLLTAAVNTPNALTWRVAFSGPAQPVLPLSGDVFRIRIRKPLQTGDAFLCLFLYDHADDLPEIPTTFKLLPLAPNPFNPQTTVRWDLNAGGWVRLSIFDLLGREVATLVDQELTAGRHAAVWNAANVASGMYIVRIRYQSHHSDAGIVRTQKALLLK